MMCDELMVMKAGKVIEAGPAARVFATPQEDYTRMLLDAVPHFEAHQARAGMSGAATLAGAGAAGRGGDRGGGRGGGEDSPARWRW